MPPLGPIVDGNVHLWDQRDNPVFWLADRTLVRDLIGDYESLPDVYTLSDYERETAAFEVRGIVWSDAGAADPVASAEWVSAGRPTSAAPGGGHTRSPRRGGRQPERGDAPRRGRDDLGGVDHRAGAPVLLAVVALFGPDRCMLGTDLPIERLRSGFERDVIEAPGRRGEGLGTSPRSAAPDGSRDRR